jgi:hypothetical protein
MASSWDSNGNSIGDSSNPDMNKDTAAYTQLGMYSNPGFFGDQSMKNSNAAFNKAVEMSTLVSGTGAYLKEQKAPSDYQRTSENYILLDKEKEAIARKSKELSTYGIVPEDALSNFFYILAAIDNHSDMVHIAKVVGIPELESSIHIHDISRILEIKDIYKVGYLANGVSSVINTFASKYSNASGIANPYYTSFGNIAQAQDLARSLGILGPILVSAATNFNSDTSVLRNISGNISSSAINQTINSVLKLASGNTTDITPSVLTNPTASIDKLASRVGLDTINSLSSSAPLGGSLSSFGSMGSAALNSLLDQVGGFSIGNYMSELVTGKRIPTQKIANNPCLRPPSYQGKAFFGETPCALPAVDQLFCRKVGSFSNPTSGSGADSFGAQNFASFDGSSSVSSVITRMVSGSSNIPSPTTYYGEKMNQMIENVCNNLNVPTNASIEMRRSDNSIPFFIALSAAIAGESFSPFGSKPISEGWKLASSTSNDIQRYNPDYLNTCRTSL